MANDHYLNVVETSQDKAHVSILEAEKEALKVRCDALSVENVVLKELMRAQLKRTHLTARHSCL